MAGPPPTFVRAVVAFLILAWGARSNAAEAVEKGQDLTSTARKMSDQGLGQYQRGELDAAIESFMGAFALSSNAGLLFNVAQAFRLKGDCARAKEYYRRYLDAVPESALKPSVDRRLDEMDACLQMNAAAGAAAARSVASNHAAPATGTPTAARAIVSSPSAPPGAPQTARTVAWTLRGSAAALLVSSAAFGALAVDAHRDVDGTSLQRPAWEANDRYRLDTTLAWTFAISGLACGALSYFVGRRR